MYFLKEYVEDWNHAGSKARMDVESIMKSVGSTSLDFKTGGKRRYYVCSIQRMMEMKKIKNGDALLIQYPYYCDYLDDLLNNFKKLRNKGAKIIAVIHDLDSLRPSGDYKIPTKKEVEILNEFDVVISHNKFMSDFLRKNNLKTTIVELEIFDYIANTGNIHASEDFKRIYIAGNIAKEKSGYIYKDEFTNIKNDVCLYGPNFEEDQLKNKSKNIYYKGCFKPEDLVNQFSNGFGLIWDGTSIDKCDGELGEYLKINNPHKTSLYLSIGIPVIIWEEAALSKFIKDNKVGFTIKSLSEIDKKLKNISFEEYKIMKNNAEKIGAKLTEGYFLKKAVNNALENF